MIQELTTVLTKLWWMIFLFLPLGAVAFFVLPAIKASKTLSPFYLDTAMSVLGRGVLRINKNGAKWYGTTRTKYNTEKMQLGGATKHLNDTADLMGRFRGAIIGIVDIEKSTIGDPRSFDLPGVIKQRVTNNEFIIDLKEGERIANAVAAIDERQTPVDPKGHKYLIQGTGDGNVIREVMNWIRIGYADMNSSRVAEYSMYVMAFIMGLVIPRVMIRISGQAGGGGVDVISNVPLFIGVVGWL